MGTCDILKPMADTAPKSRIAGIVFFITLCVPVAAFLAAWLPYNARERRGENQRNASSTLKTLCSAEWDFHENDRDANGVKDYWTGDVAGLYRFGLIERCVAEADAHPLVPLVPKPIPHNGYYFVALQMDESVNPPEVYAQDTDKKSGNVHNLVRFGFLAYPAKPESPAMRMYIVNEGNSVFSSSEFPLPKNWPADDGLRKWSHH
jgi:hypothetical protein